MHTELARSTLYGKPRNPKVCTIDSMSFWRMFFYLLFPFRRSAYVLLLTSISFHRWSDDGNTIPCWSLLQWQQLHVNSSTPKNKKWYFSYTPREAHYRAPMSSPNWTITCLAFRLKYFYLLYTYFSVWKGTNIPHFNRWTYLLEWCTSIHQHHFVTLVFLLSSW